MNFLNIGPSELMVILALAILMVGPKRMVEIARTLGRAASKLRKISGEFMAIIQAELRETEASARQLADGSITGESGVQGEVQTAGQQVQSTLASLQEDIGLGSLRAELMETERATRQFLERVAREGEEAESRHVGAAAPAASTEQEERPPEPPAPPVISEAGTAAEEQLPLGGEAAGALGAAVVPEAETQARPVGPIEQAKANAAVTILGGLADEQLGEDKADEDDREEQDQTAEAEEASG